MSRAATAPLPKTYEDAKAALAECFRIDECAKWANAAKALASYARQANDDTLQKQAMRIQGRAIRRCGELLKQFDARPENSKKPSDEKQKCVNPPLLSRRQAAADAKLTVEQQKTAVRVANVPEADFERQILKDEYLGLRLPKADKDALEVAAKETRRDPSDLAWVLIMEGLERQQLLKRQNSTPLVA